MRTPIRCLCVAALGMLAACGMPDSWVERTVLAERCHERGGQLVVDADPRRQSLYVTDRAPICARLVPVDTATRLDTATMAVHP